MPFALANNVVGLFLRSALKFVQFTEYEFRSTLSIPYIFQSIMEGLSYKTPVILINNLYFYGLMSLSNKYIL